mgnify:FL=1|jgi:hypothetical protein
MKLILTNLQKVLTKTSSLSATIISIMAIWFLFTYFKDTELIIWNLWLSFYLLEIALDTSISLLFWLFIWASVYKMIYFSSPKKKQLGLWWLAWFFWVLVWGCPACSITVASYLGLASILSVLPYDWMELKVLSLIMLLYVVYDILKTLEVCSVKKLKKCKIKK